MLSFDNKPRFTYRCRNAILIPTSVAVLPLSEKNTLLPHVLAGPLSIPLAASNAGACAFSGNMTCPYRPQACIRARCKLSFALSLVIPCVHHEAAASNLCCTVSVFSSYITKSSCDRPSITATISFLTISCCVNGHHKVSNASFANAFNFFMRFACH